MHFFRFLRDAPYFARWAQYGLLAPYWLCQYGLLHFRHFARLLRQRCHAGVGNELNSHQTDEDASLGGARIGFANTGALCLPQKTAKDCQKAVDNISSRRSNDVFCALRSAFWANPTRHGATNK